MCQYEVVSVSSRQCAWVLQGSEAHAWKRYTYRLCDATGDNGHACHDAQEIETQNDAVVGSTSLLPCRVCVRLSKATDIRDQAVAQADAEYALAEEEAYKEIRELRSQPAAESSHRRRKERSKADTSRWERSKGSGKHRSSNTKYHDDKRGNNGYDGSHGQEHTY